MEVISTLTKMPAYFTDKVHYMLPAEGDFIKMEYLLGRQISLEFLNQKFCEACTNQFRDLFRMGFCRECFFSSPLTGESIIRPELSRAHENVADRDLAFERSYQLQPHIVYLANSGGLKVGVTRSSHMLNRWIDQGASSAIVFARTSNRYEAGLIEVAMKEHLPDKTAWQRMLKNEDPPVDLVKQKEEVAPKLSGELSHFLEKESTVYSLAYPVLHYPVKVKGVNLDKDQKISAKLQGIRGQYLIFEGGAALNVRAHTGYRVKISF